MAHQGSQPPVNVHSSPGPLASRTCTWRIRAHSLPYMPIVHQGSLPPVRAHGASGLTASRTCPSCTRAHCLPYVHLRARVCAAPAGAAHFSASFPSYSPTVFFRSAVSPNDSPQGTLPVASRAYAHRMNFSFEHPPLLRGDGPQCIYSLQLYRQSAFALFAPRYYSVSITVTQSYCTYLKAPL
jgi:hypothetical protein